MLKAFFFFFAAVVNDLIKCNLRKNRFILIYVPETVQSNMEGLSGQPKCAAYEAVIILTDHIYLQAGYRERDNWKKHIQVTNFKTCSF